MCALLCLGYQAFAGELHVYKKIDLYVTAQNQPACGIFNRFFTAYVLEMGQQSKDDPARGWEFWVVLRPDPKHDDRPHVLVVAHSGGLTVRVADLDPGARLNIKQEAAHAARRSLRTMRDPFFNELARGKSATTRTLVSQGRN